MNYKLFARNCQHLYAYFSINANRCGVDESHTSHSGQHVVSAVLPGEGLGLGLLMLHTGHLHSLACIPRLGPCSCILQDQPRCREPEALDHPASWVMHACNPSRTASQASPTQPSPSTTGLDPPAALCLDSLRSVSVCVYSLPPVRWPKSDGFC